MKLGAKIALGFATFLLLIGLGVVVVILLFRSSTPRDLGVTYTEEDRVSGREKSKIVYEEAKDASTLPASEYWQTFGSNEVDMVLTNAEITAVMNNKPGVYFPYKDVQVKFNADGTGEISGRLLKSRIPTYVETFGAPDEVVDFVMRFLPEDPVFYLKGKATLVDNTVGVFEPIKLEIGRIPIPLGPILSNSKLIDSKVYALDIAGMISELQQYDNKEAMIISYINEKLAAIKGFYAEDVRMEDNALIYKGTLPEREVTVQ